MHIGVRLKLNFICILATAGLVYRAAVAEEFEMSWDDPETTFQVLVNEEGQYSVWPSYKEIAAGWRPVDKTGTRAECLAHIEELWTDMRPLSVRKQVGAPAET